MMSKREQLPPPRVLIKAMLAPLWLLCCTLLAPLAMADAVDVARQKITLLLGQEPPSLNSIKATDQVSFFILGHTHEGLLRYDAQGQLVGGVARDWKLDDRSATFWLRDDARWSDGQPVTAHDFVFAWQRVVDPAVASEYASILYPIKNAKAISEGRLPPEQLGVRALDERTLQVDLEQPTAYFLQLTAFGVYLPIREDFYRAQGTRYGAEQDRLLYNGPFRLARWVHGARLTLVKNEQYWNRAQTVLNEIDLPYVTSDSTAAYNLFKDNKVALVGLSAEELNDALKQRVKIRIFPAGSLFYLEFNHRAGRITGNRHFRRAIQRVADPQELVNRVVGVPGTLPGRSLFPVWIKGVNGSFRKEFPAPRVTIDPNQARQELELARQQLGLERFPPLVYLTGDSPTAAKQGEYLQNLLRTQLGLELKIDKQIFKQRLAKMLAGEFDLVAAGWGPDYDDIMTFGDLFASWNINNRGRYANPDYDHWVAVARDATDPRLRMEAMAALQRLVIEDAVIIPQYESGSVYLQHRQLKGVVRRVIGTDPDFTQARVVAP
jgi:oligopeptide transport system substrate-binding protein